MRKQLLITDFDGTLVDTFEANYRAYREAFAACGLTLERAAYSACFGYRYDDFMRAVGIENQDIAAEIRRLKGELYPTYFCSLVPNQELIAFLLAFKQWGGRIAVASTARRKNLQNVLSHLGLADKFDFVLAGEDVEHGKPNPEIYEKVLTHFGLTAAEAMVFEDSSVGIAAAGAAGVDVVVVTEITNAQNL